MTVYVKTISGRQLSLDATKSKEQKQQWKQLREEQRFHETCS